MENKEKKKRYFEKLRSDPQRLAAHREKERERIKSIRSKEKDLLKGRPDILENKRKVETLRKQKQRERKRLAKLEENSNSPDLGLPVELGSYKRPQSLGKAVNRVKKLLPDSPSKKQAVVRKLLSEFPNLMFTTNPRQPKSKLSDEVKQTVKDFYNRDDISYQAPGKRDTKSIKDPVTNKRINVQKRFLVMSVKEAYQQYINETGNQVTKTTFYELRPKHVLLVGDTPHTVCVCKYHGNFNYLLESLHSHKILNSELVPNGKDLLRRLVCNIEEENCMLGACLECSKSVDELENVLTIKDFDEKKNIVWKQWIDIEKRPKQVEHSGTVKDVICEIKKQLPTFRVHCYVKNVQSEEFELRKINKDPKTGVLQIDFAENFSLISQDEIQSAHWSHQQVTLFTACVWTGTATTSYTIVSDDISHQKLSIKVFMYKLVEDILKRFPSLEKLLIFSDGPSSQFKNKYTASLLCSLQNDFKIDCDWLFFATSHGKGSVDAIGGAIKHRVWIKIRSRKRMISNPFEFYECAKEEIKGTHIFFVSQENIQLHTQEMEKKWADIKSIPEIRQCHYFMPYDSTSILVARTAKSLMNKYNISKAEEDIHREIDSRQSRLRYEDVYTDESNDEEICTPTPTTLPHKAKEVPIGSWVGVIYDSQWYPGNEKLFKLI